MCKAVGISCQTTEPESGLPQGQQNVQNTFSLPDLYGVYHSPMKMASGCSSFQYSLVIQPIEGRVLHGGAQGVHFRAMIVPGEVSQTVGQQA